MACMSSECSILIGFSSNPKKYNIAFIAVFIPVIDLSAANLIIISFPRKYFIIGLCIINDFNIFVSPTMSKSALLNLYLKAIRPRVGHTHYQEQDCAASNVLNLGHNQLAICIASYTCCMLPSTPGRRAAGRTSLRGHGSRLRCISWPHEPSHVPLQPAQGGCRCR